MSGFIEEIVVTGTRGGGGGSFDWGTFNFNFNNVDYNDEPGDSGGGSSQNVNNLDETNFTEVSFGNVTFQLDLSTLPAVYVNALLYIADNLHMFPAMQTLINDLAAQGYTDIQFVGHPTHALAGDGSLVNTFDSYSPLAGVSANAAFIGSSDEAAGKKYATITINLTNEANTPASAQDAIFRIGHELEHAAFREASTEESADSEGNRIVNEIQNIDPDYADDIESNGYSNAEHGLGTSSNNHLRGGTGHDNLDGRAGNDNLFGKTGNDLLVGGSGNDQLFGASGNDELVAGAGTDALFGGAGNDKYVFDTNLSGSIGDVSGTGDLLEIQSTSNVTFTRSGASLIITDINTNQQLEVYNWFNGQTIEVIALANGTVFDANTVTAIANFNGFPIDIGFDQITVDPFTGGFFTTPQTPKSDGYIRGIVFDLDGDGLELNNLSNENTTIDWNDDGIGEVTANVRPDDALLIHLNNSESPTPINSLISLDTNNDGLINADDDSWNTVTLWRDLNQDGRVNGDEQFSFEGLGIKEVNISFDSDLDLIEQNIVLGSTSFTKVDGSIGNAGNIGLRANTDGFIWEENSDLYDAVNDYYSTVG